MHNFTAVHQKLKKNWRRLPSRISERTEKSFQPAHSHSQAWPRTKMKLIYFLFCLVHSRSFYQLYQLHTNTPIINLHGDAHWVSLLVVLTESIFWCWLSQSSGGANWVSLHGDARWVNLLVVLNESVFWWCWLSQPSGGANWVNLLVVITESIFVVMLIESIFIMVLTE